MFVNLDAFVTAIRNHAPAPSDVLEIGCGDGAVTERLARAFPNSALTGIDICAHPGRLYDGDRSRVRFLRTSVAEFCSSECPRYQLVIISDVLHHVPYPEWSRFLSSAFSVTAVGGTLILKEWVRQRTLAYLLGYCSDRFVTGDHIRYPGEMELRSIAQRTFGPDAIRAEFRVRPWRCNLALVISPRANRAAHSRSVE